MGLQRAGHDWATELKSTGSQELWLPEFLSCAKLSDDSVLKSWALPHPSVQLPLLLTSCVGVLHLLKLKNQY